MNHDADPKQAVLTEETPKTSLPDKNNSDDMDQSAREIKQTISSQAANEQTVGPSTVLSIKGGQVLSLQISRAGRTKALMQDLTPFFPKT